MSARAPSSSEPAPTWLQWVRNHTDRSIVELQRLVRQRSISSQDDGMQGCADEVVRMLEERGFRVETWETPGHPIIFAERRGRSDATVLFYNHYDVQPPEPYEAWSHPPFDAVVKDGLMHGRGTGDHKSSFVARLMAIEALLKEGELPCTVKFIVEGEEEIGSPNLAEAVRVHAEKLEADAGLYSGGAIDEQERPVIRAGSKGMCYVELSVRAARVDLHSRWAAVVPSAAWRLIEALAAIKDPASGEIRIQGFHDAVRGPDDADRAELAKQPLDEAYVLQDFAARRLIDDVQGTQAAERLQFSSTCNISGLTSGYQGVGMKSVLPAVASAKIDMRLVPDQRASDVYEKLRAHLDELGFDDVETTLLAAIDPGKASLDEPVIEALKEAARRAYGREPIVQPLTPGSGPRYVFAEHVGLHIVSDAGSSYHGAGHHSPKEHIRVDDYLRNIEHIGWFLAAFGGEARE